MLQSTYLGLAKDEVIADELTSAGDIGGVEAGRFRERLRESL